MSDLRPSACLLCGSTASEVTDSLRPAELARLWAHFGIDLPSEALTGVTAVEAIRLRACTACGFQWYDPRASGNDLFYKEVGRQNAGYYPKVCPAFDAALAFARQQRLTEVMDVGCGSGHFLDLAREAGIATHGLDVNPAAIEACRSRGHDAHHLSAEEFAARQPERRFQFITAFEVLEHLVDPVAFAAACVPLLAPGGFLMFSVPNFGGFYQFWSLEPYQWPPHHLTRWRPIDLERLARKVGLEPVRVRGDVLNSEQLRFYHRIQRQAEFALGRRQAPPSDAWPNALSWLFRWGQARRFLRWGPSQHAVFRRPAGSS